jgi:sphinganine-1-phosphate aldolase
MSSAYPYATTHDVIRGMPSEGRSRDSIIAELEGFAHDEDKTWETGKCSGTMYCGDHTHYEFLGRAFELFSHMNALQRDM